MADKRITFRSILTWLLILTVTSSLAISQDDDKGKSRSNQFEAVQRPTVQNTGAAVALEGPIDPDVYKLGPGDMLEFRVWSAFEVTNLLSVGPDGSVSVPSLGRIEVAGLTVNQAASEFALRAEKHFPRTSVTLRLIGVRKIKVTISGAVRIPGTYEVTAVDRLSDLLRLAGGLYRLEDYQQSDGLDADEKQAQKSRQPEEDEEQLPKRLSSLRHLQLSGAGIEASNVDYIKFLNAGKTDHNPVLFDGAAVHVPFMEEDVGVVSVLGAVRIPGDYEYSEGDRVSDILEIACGLNNNAFLESVSVKRFTESGENEELVINLEEDGNGLKLKADDRLFIREKPEYHRKYSVEITGEVKYPGKYPIEKVGSKLTDIIDVCGGFTERANLKSAKVERTEVGEIFDPEFERLKFIPIAEMTEMEYEYFKTRSREEAPAVVVDFEQLFVEGNESEDILLKDLDVINIPALLPTVNVTGQVNRPGLVSWVKGKRLDYYIEKAGGYSWNARTRKIRIIRAQTGMWVKPRRDIVLEIGDTIFVPEKQEIDYWELWKDLLLVASQVATVILVIQQSVR